MRQYNASSCAKECYTFVHRRRLHFYRFAKRRKKKRKKRENSYHQFKECKYNVLHTVLYIHVFISITLQYWN